jgi:anaphase-promoting complex subunit 2
MIRDIQTSRNTNSWIRRLRNLEPDQDELEAAATRPGMTVDEVLREAEGLHRPSLHAKILSRLFWPQLHEESYRVPTEVKQLMEVYENAFEATKAARKLTWLHALGQAVVELDLEDRVVREEVHTWQATIIWAFQGEGVNGEPLSRTVEDLVEYLEMDEVLVRAGLTFWVGKLVLHEISSDVYSVLETLNQAALARESAAAAAAAAATGEASDDPALLANEQDAGEELRKYWPLIQGMLTNSMSQMPLMQIGMMLRMVVEGGFPYGDEELGEFLRGEVDAGRLELVGGRFKLKK